MAAPPEDSGPGRLRAPPHKESIILHGTWANGQRAGRWWRPSEEFHRHLGGHDLGKALYAGRDGDEFEWSGNLRQHQREVAGKALWWWANRPDGAGRFHVAFAHSHGGTVLLWAAAHRGLETGLMVAMACPAYGWKDAEFREITRRVPIIVSVRADHDPALRERSGLAERLLTKAEGLGRRR